MRITIISDDALVAIDGEFIQGVDMTSMPSEIHAIQWYETYGEIEFKDGRVNERFENFEERFANFISLFEERKIDIRRNSPPNPYSDWNEETKEWVENSIKKTAFDISEQVDYYKYYLQSTDWYYARLQETGAAVPEDVVTNRINARTYIQEHDV